MHKLILLLLPYCCIINLTYANVYMQKDAQGNMTYTDVPSKNSQPVQLPTENSTQGLTTPQQNPTNTAAPTSTPGATTVPMQSSTSTPAGPPGAVAPSAPPAPGAPAAPSAPAAPAAVEYKTFMIVSPKDGESIQNQPTIDIEINLDPKLQSTDKIQILLDGKLWGAPYPTNKIQIEGVDRGTHQLSAVLINKDQRIIKQSNAITIYVHQASTNAPALKTNPNVPRPAF